MSGFRELCGSELCRSIVGRADFPASSELVWYDDVAPVLSISATSTKQLRSQQHRSTVHKAPAANITHTQPCCSIPQHHSSPPPPGYIQVVTKSSNPNVPSEPQCVPSSANSRVIRRQDSRKHSPRYSDVLPSHERRGCRGRGAAVPNSADPDGAPAVSAGGPVLLFPARPLAESVRRSCPARPPETKGLVESAPPPVLRVAPLFLFDRGNVWGAPRLDSTSTAVHENKSGQHPMTQ